MRCCPRRKRSGSGRTEAGRARPRRVAALVPFGRPAGRLATPLSFGYLNSRSHTKSTNTRSFGDNCRLDGQTIENCPGAIR